MKNKQPIILVFILMFFCCNGLVKAKESSYLKLRENYNTDLKKTNRNLDSLKAVRISIDSLNIDSSSIKIEKIKIYNKNKFKSLSKINDTISAKKIMTEETKYLNSLNNLFNNKNSSTNSKLSKALNSKIDEINWLQKNKSENLGINRCNDCFFSRYVELYVIKINEDYRLDTLKCTSVECEKRIPGSMDNNPLYKYNFISYPCDESNKVSTGKFYFFSIKIDDKNYSFEKEIPPGNSESDILKLILTIH